MTKNSFNSYPLFVPTILVAQNIKPKGSFQVHIGLPVNIANEPFKGFMQGLVIGSAHYQLTTSGKRLVLCCRNRLPTFWQADGFKAPAPATGGNAFTSWLRLYW